MFGKPSSDLTQCKDRAAKYIAKGDWNDALKYLKKAQELAPKDTYIARKIGDVFQRKGDNDAAVEAYKHAASLFAAAGFLIKAISVNKIILSLKPDDKEVQDSLAALYSSRREQDGIDERPSKSARPTLARPGPPSPEASEAREAQADQPLTGEISIDLARVDRERLPWTPLFSSLNEDELNLVIDKLVPVSAAAGTQVCREGDEADSLYVIATGLVRVSSRDADGNPLWLTNLRDGEFFGEFGFFCDGKRHADVVTLEDTELLQIGRKEVGEITEKFPRIQEVLHRFYRERVVDILLAKNPLFRSLTPEQRKELVEQTALEVHEAGSLIIQEGDDGESLYIIKSGVVRVYTALQEGIIDLAELKPGDIFGEISILTGMPTTANVEASARTELVKFSKREVVAMAEKHQQLAHLLSETKEHRVHEHIQRLQTEGFV